MRILGIALLAALASCNGGCSAPEKAKEFTLLPAMRLAWASIQPQAEASATALPEAERLALGQALASMSAELRAEQPNPAVMLGNWPPIRIAAEMQIERQLTAQQIGPRVSLSLAQRLIQFESALQRFSR